MSPIIAWFARNSVAANLLMAVMAIGGILSVFTLPKKSFPDIDIDRVAVSVLYLGAAPEEVEEGVCVRIEEQIDGIDGIEEVRSNANEGSCAVSVELVTGADVDRALGDIKNQVDAINTFPEEAEKPITSVPAVRRAVADVAISGPVDEFTLTRLAEAARDSLSALPGITQVEVGYTRPYEVSIEVSEEDLRRFGLRFDQVVRAVRRSSLDLPGGRIKTQAGEVLLRTKGQAYRRGEFERLVVITRADGTRVTLGEIATVVDGFEDLDVAARFDGEPAAMVRVYRVGDQDLVDIADAVAAWVERERPRLPEGVSMTIWQDGSKVLRGRLDTLLRNGRSGLALVLVTLALFLRLRLALWVSLGVPVAFLGALQTMPVFGLSIDIISLFAFIVVLGIVVDDAIVVAESVHAHERRSGDRLQAAISGTQEVTTPVIFGVLTTVAAFLPLLFVPGFMGQVFSVIGSVVICCLVFSVVESQLVLPSHLAHGRSEREGAAADPTAQRGWWRPFGSVARGWRRLQGAVSGWLERVVTERYQPALAFAIEWRYATVATALALLLATVGVIAGGHRKFSFFPPLEGEFVSAYLTMPQGTPVAVTQEGVDALLNSAERLRVEVDERHAAPGESLFKHALASIGSQAFRGSGGPPGAGGAGASGAHLGEVVLELVASEERAVGAAEIANRWRELTRPVPGAVELVFPTNVFSAGEAINIQLQGPDVDDLEAAAVSLKELLAGYSGVIDISDSFRSGKREVKLAIMESAEMLGLTLEDLGRQVRQAFYGEEAQRIQRGRDDVRVMVRYPEGERRSLADLENMRIRTDDGAEVPFRSVARADYGHGFSTIRRADRMRVVNVTADVDRAKTTANAVLADLGAGKLDALLAEFPRVKVSLEGEQREQQRALGGLARSYVLALLGIYALLAIPLRSYTQPLIIMSVIPFGLVGAIVGHLVMGRHLSFMSVIGIVALSGVVVNASLVLVEFVNRRRAEGVPHLEAVRLAGAARFRPIVLTSLTTFVGLTPLMSERALQAQFLIPMAISLAWGVLFATAITLLIVPCGYVILEDLRALTARRGGVPAAGAARPSAAGR